MRTITRLTLTITITLILLLALAACGDSEPADGAADTATAPQTRGTEQESAPAPGSTETDREILITLYNALDGPNWEDKTNWLSDAPLGEWEGVTTGDNGRVTRLWLGVGNSGQALNGEMPPELGGLEPSYL